MRHVLTAASLLALSTLGACAETPDLGTPEIAPADQPRFNAITFFAGRSEGQGQLSQVFSANVPVRVESEGTVEDGALLLVQQIHEGGKPVRTREWLIREDRPGHYTGTLSDAEGAVTGTSEGNRLHLAFTMKGGLQAQQWLTLSPDGRRAHNVLKVCKWGVTVAVLSEDIRRLE